MFVVGTAGHIDHGKSSLINRLTGIDPDRLPEEKQRGMTIDLGFAYYDTSDGSRVGIVDVPGHERFVRNMIAGAGGIDAVILVVAADDGWMPQSREHLQITKLLNVQHGFIALTKIDLVDPDWLDLVEEDVKSKVENTFLEHKPVVRLSSVTGDGFDALKAEIENLAKTVVDRQDIEKPRLYVDRSFVLSGMGGVVAGTLKGGSLVLGHEIAVFPSGKKGKIRTMQSHGEQIDAAYPGQRTSISLTGIDKEYLNRGNALTTVAIAQTSDDHKIIAASVQILPESAVILNNRRKVLLIAGTTEVEAEVRLLDDKPIIQGQEGIAFIKPFEPILTLIGDRFILRLPTPQITIGGGQVVDLIDTVPRRKDIEKYAYLNDLKDFNYEKYIEFYLEKYLYFKTEDLLLLNCSEKRITDVIESLRSKGVIEKIGRYFFSHSGLGKFVDRVTSILKNELDQNPHLDGVSMDVILNGFKGSRLDIEFMMETLVDKNIIAKKKNRFDLPEREISVKGDIKTIADKILSDLLASGFSPQTLKEILAGGNSKDQKKNKEAVDYLISSQNVVKAGQLFIYHIDKWTEIIELIRATLNNNEALTVAFIKDKLGISRKYAVPILEETDSRQITLRRDDIRIKGVRFEKE